MRTYLVFTLGSMLGLASVLDPAAASIEGHAAPSVMHVAQNTGAIDRSLGNGSMGAGEGIERLPESLEAERDRNREQGLRKKYDDPGHGDNDTDMEHRPRRTLGDRDDD